MPFGPFVQRGLLVALFTFVLFLIFSERSASGLASSVRSLMLDGLVPVVDMLSKPVEAVDDAAGKVSSMWSVWEENKRLKLENERLLQWQQTALRFEAENVSLRDLLNYHPPQAKASVTAKVVGTIGNSFGHRLRIDAGSDQGIRRHQAVMNDQGLVGRVITVGKHSSEVLLITDMNSRIPVTVDPMGIQALLVGDRSELPYLTFASARHVPQLGAMVVTAADGDIFPAGLPVGKVFSDEEGRQHVRPLADMQTLRFVRVMAFDLPSDR